MLKIPQEDQKLLLRLTDEKGLSKELIIKLVNKATEVRYIARPIGFKDEISDLIKEYANDKKVFQ